MRMSMWVRTGVAACLVAGLAWPVAILAGEGQRRTGRSWSDDDNGPKETETVDRAVAFPANGRLRLKNFSGDIRIVGTRGRDVVVKARRRAARPQLDHIKLDIQTSGATVTIDANKRDDQWEREDHNNNVVETTFEIEVPASATLDIDAFSSDVIIEGVEGEQQLKTFSGDITVKGARNDVEAETFSADITLDLGSNARGNVRFSTFSGGIDAPITLPSGRRWGKSVEGTLPGGSGPALRVKTFSGDLTIR